MTDRERLVALLNEWGVPYEEDSDETETTVRVGDMNFSFDPSPKITGYAGFYTSFTFHSDGSFKNMGAWE